MFRLDAQYSQPTTGKLQDTFFAQSNDTTISSMTRVC